MDNDRFRRIQEIFNAALDVPPHERAHFVFDACRDDWRLHQEVTSLLSHYAADDWLPGASQTGEKAAPASGAPRSLESGSERYELVDVLGEGGMGVVYLAEQTHPIRRRVALKVIKLGVDSRRATARFESERQALAMMDHPNISRVFEAGATEDGRLYFAMEFVPGPPITEYCDRERLSVRDRVQLFIGVCDAVQHAHQRGIIHRDIKPSNILVTSQDGQPTPKIIDFGVARATNQRLTEHTMFTQLGVVVGSLRYMSPEQADCRLLEIDTRTDVYALGAVLYELLAGCTPLDIPALEQTGYAEIQRRIREEEPPRPSERVARSADAADVAGRRACDATTMERQLRGDLDWIVLKALEKDRTRRYGTAAELAADLQRYLSDDAVLAGPPTRRYRMKKFISRNRGPVIAGTAVAIAITLGFITSTSLFLENRRSRRLAEAQRDEILRLSDATVLDRLQAEVSTLRPPHPATIPAMKSWLAEADELAARLPLHRKTLASLRAEGIAVHAPGDTAVTAIRFADQQRQFHYEHLARLVKDLGRFVDPDPHVGSIARVRERLAFAETIFDRSITAHRREWNEAIRSISDVKECPKYGGLVIAPQVGLVPVGRDPDTGLWEFVHLRSGEPPRRTASGKIIMAGDTGIVLVLLPGDCYWMGMSKDKLPDPNKPSGYALARYDEVPVHRVCLDPFFMSKYEVTQGQWLRLTGTNPSHVRPGIDYGMYMTSLRHPVESISWNDADGFARDIGLLLPTEAQWEYAARAGSTGPFPCGWDPKCLGRTENLLDASAKVPGRPGGWRYADWYDGFVDSSPVGFFAPNAFGLHDVLGNVAEWTRDWYGPYTLPVTPGDGALVGAPHVEKVLRGGAYYYWWDRVSLSLRFNLQPHNNQWLGMRPSRQLDPPSVEERAASESRGAR